MHNTQTKPQTNQENHTKAKQWCKQHKVRLTQTTKFGFHYVHRKGSGYMNFREIR